MYASLAVGNGEAFFCVFGSMPAARRYEGWRTYLRAECTINCRIALTLHGPGIMHERNDKQRNLGGKFPKDVRAEDTEVEGHHSEHVRMVNEPAKQACVNTTTIIIKQTPERDQKGRKIKCRQRGSSATVSKRDTVSCAKRRRGFAQKRRAVMLP